jgi:hypothetical protein
MSFDKCLQHIFNHEYILRMKETPNSNAWCPKTQVVVYFILYFWNWVRTSRTIKGDTNGGKGWNQVHKSTTNCQKFPATNCQQHWIPICPGKRGGSAPERGGSGVCSEPTVLWVTGGINTHSRRPQRLSSSSLRLRPDWSSLSLNSIALKLPSSKIRRFLEGFSLWDREKAKEDHSPPFPCTWRNPSRLVCLLLLEPCS